MKIVTTVLRICIKKGKILLQSFQRFIPHQGETCYNYSMKNLLQWFQNLHGSKNESTKIINGGTAALPL